VTSLSVADGLIRLNAWLPPHDGVGTRLGGRWISVLSAIPPVVALLILAVAVAGTMPGVQEFIVRYPRCAECH
jgi:hypothetical protein